MAWLSSPSGSGLSSRVEPSRGPRETWTLAGSSPSPDKRVEDGEEWRPPTNAATMITTTSAMMGTRMKPSTRMIGVSTSTTTKDCRQYRRRGRPPARPEQRSGWPTPLALRQSRSPLRLASARLPTPRRPTQFASARSLKRPSGESSSTAHSGATTKNTWKLPRRRARRCALRPVPRRLASSFLVGAVDVRY